MANKPKQDPGWLSSDEARKRLRISSCELMHWREAGRLTFRKQGNAFLYSEEEVQRHVRATYMGQSTSGTDSKA